MKIGRLYIETSKDQCYYQDRSNGAYYRLGDLIEKTEFEYWCIRVRRICRGVWWASKPNVYERRDTDNFVTVLFNWFPFT